jgi:phosphate transport system substrate-binding protein
MSGLKSGPISAFLVIASLTVSSVMGAGASKVDPNIPEYTKVAGVDGNLSSVGSDTLLNLMTLWSEAFQKQYPNVKVQIEGKGSSTAPPALLAGTAQIGPMSRKMKSEEEDAFEKKFGYKPTCFRVAIDALAVYVNKDNPVEKATFEQLDAVFSRNRLRGYPQDITTWGQLGLTGEWADKPIRLYGRNSASGTYAYFKEEVLTKKGDYRETVKEQPGSASVVMACTEDLYGMGYSGIGYRTSGVKTLAVAQDKDSQPFSTDPENVLTGKYPLARFLFLNVNKAPNKGLDPLVLEFLKSVLSRQGQEIVVKDGFMPLSAKQVEEEMKKLQ